MGGESKAREVQYKIRENALQQSSFLEGMSQWEREIRVRDKDMKKQKEASSKEAAQTAMPRRSGLRVGVKDAAKKLATEPSSVPKDSRYGAWEQLEDDKEAQKDPKKLQKDGPRPRAAAPPGDPEAAQRELGNAAFARGDFEGAVKSYTVCLGLKKDNVTAFSNRAMAYLKLKEYNNAEADCSAALKVDKTHLKSLQRRATARTFFLFLVAHEPRRRRPRPTQSRATRPTRSSRPPATQQGHSTAPTGRQQTIRRLQRRRTLPKYSLSTNLIN